MTKITTGRSQAARGPYTVHAYVRSHATCSSVCLHRIQMSERDFREEAPSTRHPACRECRLAAPDAFPLPPRRPPPRRRADSPLAMLRMARLAGGLATQSRLAIARLLVESPRRRDTLQDATGLGPAGFQYNLDVLLEARVVESRRGVLHLTPAGRGLMVALERLARVRPTG